MKKIRKSEAIHLIRIGIYPQCEVARDEYVPIKSFSDFDRLERLSTVQGFTLWGYEDAEIEAFKIPEDALPVTKEEAYDFIISNNPNDCIIMKVIGAEDTVFSHKYQMRDFENLWKKCERLGVPYLLYWCE